MCVCVCVCVYVCMCMCVCVYMKPKMLVYTHTGQNVFAKRMHTACSSTLYVASDVC